VPNVATLTHPPNLFVLITNTDMHAYGADESSLPRVAATFFFRPAPSARLLAPPSPLLADRKPPAKVLTFQQWSTRVANRYERHKIRVQRKRGERPSSAQKASDSQVLAQDIHVAECGTSLQLLGPALPGRDKYLGGELVDGKIYAIPGHARQVLRIDTQSGAVDHIGPIFEGKYKWLRSVSARDGRGRECIYGLPCHASSVLKIVPETGEVTTLGDLGDGLWKYHGAVVANGLLIAVPQRACHYTHI
jgi:hypothetical protein